MGDVKRIYVEKKAPYAVRVYICDEGWIDDGAEIYRDLIRLYHKCKTENSCLVDGYIPLTVEECEDAFDENMSREDKELITKAINYRRKGEQKEANRRRLNRQEEE